MKKALIIVAVIIVLIVVGVYYLFSRLDSLIAGAIEDRGSRATSTDVSVSGVDISLRQGSGSIKGLSVANPEGFSDGAAFSLGDITLQIDIESLAGDPIVIERISISAPRVMVEVRENGKTNIEELRRNVAEYAGGGGEQEGGAPGGEKRIRIMEFVFEKGMIEFDASAIGLERKTLDLPEIRLEDIGGPGGALPGEIASAVTSALAGRVAAAAASSGIAGEAKEMIKKGIGDKAKSLLEKAGG